MSRRESVYLPSFETETGARDEKKKKRVKQGKERKNKEQEETDVEKNLLDLLDLLQCGKIPFHFPHSDLLLASCD